MAFSLAFSLWAAMFFVLVYNGLGVFAPWPVYCSLLAYCWGALLACRSGVKTGTAWLLGLASAVVVAPFLILLIASALAAFD